MRFARPLVLLLLIGALAVVGGTYYYRSIAFRKESPVVPEKLPPGVDAQYSGWQYFDRDEKGGARVAIRAKDYRQLDNPPRTELVEVEVRVRTKDGTGYDRVKSAKAEFDQTKGTMYSEGEVEIVRNIKEGQEQPDSKLLNIRTSGMLYDVKNGHASTDRPANFTFDRAEGKCTGADYDPAKRELTMKADVELHIKPVNPKDDVMVIQAGNLVYKEDESKVYLQPWAKLIRGTRTLEGNNAVVTLKDQDIDRVDADNAKGGDKQPDRTLEYASAKMVMLFDGNREIREVTGERDSHLVSRTANAETTVNTQRLQMNFITSKGSSVLERATGTGQTVVEAKPIPRTGVQLSETKVLRSDVVNVKMKPGGEYLESAETATPGTLEFLPNRPEQHKRRIEGERLWVTYGDENRIKTFRATNVATRTEPLPPDPKKVKKGAPPPPPALTWSKVLAADYDDKGQLARMEQSQDFRYQEGDRQARAVIATLDPVKDVITLDQAARVWDNTGATAADVIVMHQKTDEFTATGNVTSSHLPDKKPAPVATAAAPAPPAKPADPKNANLFSDDEPMQAKAAKMISREKNRKVQYEGNAVLWQGSNRIQADRVDIDRTEKKLIAQGNVISELVDQNDGSKKKDKDSKAEKKPAATPGKAVFTVIRSPQLIYTDKDRLAFYKGGVLLNRPDMEVKSDELRAFLKKEDSGGSGLDKAYADGHVQIHQKAPDRTREGYSEHAEYYLDDEKVVLSGGDPRFVDSKEGTTRGRVLTYYSAEDKFIVDGAEKAPAQSRLRRKKS